MELSDDWGDDSCRLAVKLRERVYVPGVRELRPRHNRARVSVWQLLLFWSTLHRHGSCMHVAAHAQHTEHPAHRLAPASHSTLRILAHTAST